MVSALVQDSRSLFVKDVTQLLLVGKESKLLPKCGLKNCLHGFLTTCREVKAGHQCMLISMWPRCLLVPLVEQITFHPLLATPSAESPMSG